MISIDYACPLTCYVKKPLMQRTVGHIKGLMIALAVAVSVLLAVTFVSALTAWAEGWI
jgi:hypothetical protein